MIISKLKGEISIINPVYCLCGVFVYEKGNPTCMHLWYKISMMKIWCISLELRPIKKICRCNDGYAPQRTNRPQCVRILKQLKYDSLCVFFLLVFFGIYRLLFTIWRNLTPEHESSSCKLLLSKDRVKTQTLIELKPSSLKEGKTSFY